MKKLLGLTILTVTLTGCGQSGALYLPPTKTPPTPPPAPKVVVPTTVPMSTIVS